MILRGLLSLLCGVFGFSGAAVALTPNFLNQRLIPPYTGPQFGAGQGASVALAGDFVVVGAPFDDLGGDDAGVVKIYSATTGELIHTLLNPVPRSGEQFGGAVAISGSLVAVACSRNFLGDQQDAGSVYIYNLAAATPTLPIHAVDNPDPQAFDHFGNSVALAGTRLVVGASDDRSDGSQGRAFVYELGSEKPTIPILILKPPSSESIDNFGAAVAIAGSRMAVSSTFRNPGGVVFVYELDGGVPGTPAFTLHNPIPKKAQFGCSITLAGSRVAVGSREADVGGLRSGAVYVFDLANSTPQTPVYTINNPTPDGSDAFGFAVSMGEHRLAVGAPKDETGGAPQGGSISVYNLAGPSPTVPTFTFRSPSPSADDAFGTAVSMDTTRVLVGAPGDQPSAAGAAYLHELSAPNPHLAVATFNALSPAGGDRFGKAIALSGSRLVVGAPRHDSEVRDAGRVYVYDLNGGPPESPILVLENPSPQIADQFGLSVAISGDLVAVGTPMDASVKSGTVYVYNLASPTPAVPVLTLPNPVYGFEAEFGNSLAISGTTLVVGAWKRRSGTHNGSGAAYVYDLASATPSTSWKLLENPVPGSDDHFGVSVAISGRLIVVGAHENDSTVVDAGTIYVYDLSGAIPEIPVATLENPAPAIGDRFGFSVAISGNRIVAGALEDDAAALNAGSAYIYDLASATPSAPLFSLPNPAAARDDFFGNAVTISGSRVLIGAYRKDAVTGNGGAGYLYDLAGVDPVTPVAALSNPAAAIADEFGYSVVMDGTQAALGAIGEDTPSAEKGAVYFFTPSPFAEWKLEQLGNEFAPDLEDPDHDGIPTLVEYAILTAPLTPNVSPPLRAEIDPAGGGRLRLRLQRDPRRRDVTIEVLAASSLAGPWSSIAESIFGAPFTGPAEIIGDEASPGIKTIEIRDVFTVTESVSRFLRLEVSN